MLRTAVATLRQPRYAALAGLMVFVALICVTAGTWQIQRFNESVRDNNALLANAHAARARLTTSRVPLVGDGPTPGRDDIRYRTVTVTGTYDTAGQQFVRLPGDDGTSEFDVLTPLRTASGVLLVVRGTVSNHSFTVPPGRVAPAPSRPVTLTGRLQTAATSDDHAGTLGHRTVESINPAQQAASRSAPVYNAYLALNPHQPGASGLTANPKPDLSNPAGGAYEWQHFAYIVQWYLFALLALAAPFAMRTHEVREARRQFLGVDTDNDQFDLVLAGGSPTGRAQLPGPDHPTDTLVLRDAGALVQHHEASQRWRQAARMADRYGRSLGDEDDELAARAVLPRRQGAAPEIGPVRRVAADSSQGVHRSHDAHHGSYNDYLWQLALADGTAPPVEVPGAPQGKPTAEPRAAAPVVIDADQDQDG